MLGRIFIIFYKGDNFYDFLLAFLQPKPVLKGIGSERSRFFAFGVDNF